MRTLIAYLSYSGNTKEVAEAIQHKVGGEGMSVDMHEIGIDPPIDASSYDLIFIGTFTWEYGQTPDEVKDFVLEIGYKPDNVYVFGTGDTQFGGDELFCMAACKLATFYHSRYEPLKIEQSPRGTQESIINTWVEGVLDGVTSYA